MLGTPGVRLVAMRLLDGVGFDTRITQKAVSCFEIGPIVARLGQGMLWICSDRGRYLNESFLTPIRQGDVDELPEGPTGGLGRTLRRTRVRHG